MCKDLTQTTFIIPLKVEHPDRLRNAKTILGFLNHHFITNVFIYEVSSDGETKLDFLETLTNLKIDHWVSLPDRPLPDSDTEVFHRTRYLNFMLDQVTTPVVSNYDIDVLLKPEYYEMCQNLILEGVSDVIYPFKFGQSGQIRVLEGFNYDKFNSSGFNLDQVNIEGPMNYYDSEFGHCIFFNTEIYRRCGGENENFISYGPEDKERGYRFRRMGFNVRWIEESIVYHFEHFRGNDSGGGNPYLGHNWEIFNNLMSMSDEELKNYYKNQEYLREYDNFTK